MDEQARIQRLREWLEQNEQTDTASLRLAVDVMELRALFNAMDAATDAHAALVDRVRVLEAAVGYWKAQSEYEAVFRQYPQNSPQYNAALRAWQAAADALDAAAPQPAAAPEEEAHRG